MESHTDKDTKQTVSMQPLLRTKKETALPRGFLLIAILIHIEKR